MGSMGSGSRVIVERDVPLLAFERRMALAEVLKQNPVLTVDEVAERFGISTQTARRDLDELARQGLIRRTHGGAVARDQDPLSRERAFIARERERAVQKKAIAEVALSLVEPASTVIMDASTSVIFLARALPHDIALNVTVNALPIALELSERPNVTITTIGGELRRTSLSATGVAAEAALRRLFADCAFISVRGLSMQRGLTEASTSESALKEVMIGNAKRVVALVDSSKLGRTAFSFFAPVTALDVLITDDGADPRILAQLRESGLQVHVATVPDAGHVD